MKWTSGTIVVLGTWLIIAPWVLQYGNGTAVAEDLVLGILVLGVAIWSTSVSAGVTGPAWINVLFGIWVTIAPWVLGYSADTPRAAGNDIFTGTLIIVFALVRVGFGRRVRVGGTPSGRL